MKRLIVVPVATLALAFGLGGRQAAGAVSAGRYVRDSLRIGDVISVADHRGRIVAIELTATVLETPQSAQVRVPNHVLLDSVVVVEARAPDEEPGAAQA